MYTGPHLVKDNLVFGYDTGYGIADNSTATRFYPGENTVNLLNYDTTMPTWPSNSSNMASLTSKTSARSFTVIGTCNVPGAMTFVYPSISTNTAFHTISATFTNNSSETSNVALYIRGLNNATSTVNQQQTTTMQPGESVRKTLIGNVLTANNGYTAAVGVWSHGTSGQVNMNVTDVQFEEKTHATPWVDGTRSSTQSLIDLKRTTDIDVTNVSFDSTGQPSFDGTNDQINLDSSASIIPYGHTITVEAVVKWDDLVPNGVVVSYGGNQSGAGFLLQNEFSAGLEFVLFDGNGNSGRAKILSANSSQYLDEYIHMVGVYDGSNIILYINGAQAASASYTNGYPQQSYFRIGNEYNRSYYANIDLSVVKIYNQALSAGEVKQNYNAYKNRFGI